ncbi:MAG TPA: DUF4215 domain-containing protein [Myxococcota bacterium]|jgi:cysteine-rich repeat protein|nr:DUF4215 domain-containing protein [Myxococcota bacterium]
MRRLLRGSAASAALPVLGLLSCLAACSPEHRRAARCGNGDLDMDQGETCDDGNLDNGDGCNAQCQIEINCGDGIIDPAEECDDGNTVPLDGCDENCIVEGGGACGPGVPVLDANALGMSVGGRFIIVGEFNTNDNDFLGLCPGELNDGTNGLDLAFKYVVPGSGAMTLNVTTANGTPCMGGPAVQPEDVFDTLVYVRSDCVTVTSELGCNDDINTVLYNFCSAVDVPVNGGDTVYIILDSIDASSYGKTYVLDINLS